MKPNFILISCGLTLLLSGCVTPLSVERSAVQVPSPKQDKPGSIAIGVIEDRSLVVLGRRKDQYEGVIRTIYGIPTSYNNIEKKLFSEYIGDRLAKGFSNARYIVTKLSIPKGASNETVRSEVIAAQTDRALILRMNEWQFDWGGFIVPAWELLYDVDVTVYDRKGNILAKRSFSGRDEPHVDMADSIINNSLKYYQKKLKEFLEDPQIAKALQQR